MKLTLPFALATMILISTSGSAQSVRVDYDKETDFKAYRTYSWIEGQATANPRIDEKIVEVLDRHLAAAGLELVDEDSDVEIAYYASSNTRIEIDRWDYRPRWRWARTMEVTAIPTGTVVVDIIDTEDGALCWRAIGSGTISSDPAKNKSRIEKAATKMFKKFPRQK